MSHEFLENTSLILKAMSATPQSKTADKVNRSINAALRAYIRLEQREWDVFSQQHQLLTS